MVKLKNNTALEYLDIVFKEDKKLSVQYCKKILNRNGNSYTDEQVKRIRDFLYFVAQMDYDNYKAKTNGKEGNLIHQGVNRRTG